MILNDLKEILIASRAYVYQGKSKREHHFRRMEKAGFKEMYDQFGEREVVSVRGHGGTEDGVLDIFVKAE